MGSGLTPEDDARACDRRIWLVAVPIALFVLIAFAPARENDFVNWDDDLNLRDNPHLRGSVPARIAWAWTTFHLGVYQPLAWWLFEAESACWGFNPRGYHLTSIVLHAANAVVLYILTMTLLVRCRPASCRKSPWTCALAAGLATAMFAVHPLRVEVVAWASCQPYLPCALFSMLAVLAYLRAFEAEPVARRGWLAATFVLFVAAMLSHAIAVSLPAVLLILDVYPLGRLEDGPGRWFGSSARRALREKIPFFLASLVFVGLAVAARSRDVFSTVQLAGSARIAQACYGTWFYILKTVRPRDLVAVYPLPREIDWRSPPFLASILGTLGVSVVLFLLRRRWPGLLAAWLSYLLILAPNSGLIRTSQQMAADRYSYLAMVGGSIVVAAGLFRLAARSRAPALGSLALGLAVLPVLILLTREQCRTWHDSRTLWTHALGCAGGTSSVAHYNLGHDFLRRGNPRSAAAHYAAALRIDPDNVAVHHNLGVALSRQGKYSEAASQHAEALRLDPGFAGAHYNLGVILARQGKLDEAEAHYVEALRLDPGAVDAHYNLAMILSSRGRYAEAEVHYKEALRLDPGLAGAHNNLGTDLARQGKLAEAEAHYNAALRLDPRRAETHTNLGIVLSRQGRLDAAAAHFAEALRLDPDSREARENLERDRRRQGRAGKPLIP